MGPGNKCRDDKKGYRHTRRGGLAEGVVVGRHASAAPAGSERLGGCGTGTGHAV